MATQNSTQESKCKMYFQMILCRVSPLLAAGDLSGCHHTQQSFFYVKLLFCSRPFTAMTDTSADGDSVTLQSPVEVNRRQIQRVSTSNSMLSGFMNKSLVRIVSDWNIQHFLSNLCILQASASVFVDPHDGIQFTKTGKLSGGNFVSTETSQPSSSASTPYPSRPASSLPSHSYTLHQVHYTSTLSPSDQIVIFQDRQHTVSEFYCITI
jgi:hypothetical protein